MPLVIVNLAPSMMHKANAVLPTVMGKELVDKMITPHGGIIMIFEVLTETGVELLQQSVDKIKNAER